MSVGLPQTPDHWGSEDPFYGVPGLDVWLYSQSDFPDGKTSPVHFCGVTVTVPY